MPSNHLILCCPLLILPSIFPIIRVFSNESALHIKQFTGGKIVSPGYILVKLPATINRSPWRLMGFPVGTRGKEHACQFRRCNRWGFDPWVREIPRERKWRLSPVWTEEPGSLGHKDPLGKEMATHYRILACRILWTEQPSRLRSTGLPRVRHYWSNLAYKHGDWHWVVLLGNEKVLRELNKWW